MNPVRHLRRVAGVLAGLAGAWLGLAVAAPAAFAAFAIGPPIPRPAGYSHQRRPHPGEAPAAALWALDRAGVQGPRPGPHRGGRGMPGWQIALIALGAALLAATIAVLADRAWAARRKQLTAAT